VDRAEPFRLGEVAVVEPFGPALIAVITPMVATGAEPPCHRVFPSQSSWCDAFRSGQPLESLSTPRLFSFTATTLELADSDEKE
jgi:hypothetical protein